MHTPFFAFLILFSTSLFSHSDSNDLRWGQIGHYVTGHIAENHITENTAAEIERVIGKETIASATVWMDDIRSDSTYDYTNTWHWVTIPDGMTYDETEKNPEGDIIAALEESIARLKEGGLSEQEEYERLKFVMHMVGDIHQPLHVGTGEDLGGNRVRVHWMGNNSNLHRVWDSDMINSRQMSYTEIAMNLDVVDEDQVREWQSADVRDWANESVSYRDDVYDLPDDNRIGYEYRFQNYHIVEKRLVQAGVRLAGVLNDIYDR
ncbi:S1/P1 Nuclease [Rhodohalobacter sp. SW132]|uniref:S1/P1 nuclease n=1 Tax=Rhodohalobacter sp. SW132 TaxID=2293433 RepID=UPI000E2409FE|nr:S1/P1 nuclease [Rhodohalobacter sp. SW132]REL33065.1 S1/P1 Nuclease [Rhodohalobacter sp. SW132]